MISKEDSVRQPKWIILPKRSTFQNIKWQLREIFPWIKDMNDGDLRLWKLNSDLTETEYIEQIAKQVASSKVSK
jgi:hypothetical protein